MINIFRSPESAVNYSCLSCRAKYVIPDRRVSAAGADGLRVRCSRCRAIMAVHLATTEAVFGEAGGATTAMTTGVMRNPFSALAMPDGDRLAERGASRDVTGIFLPMLATLDVPEQHKEHSNRLFFAAIDGRSRGAFTAREMVMLAEKGKVRANTLMWRSGASGWKPLRSVTEFDVGWLQDAVRRRKRREQEAEKVTLQKHGITPILLERRTIRVASGPTGAPQLPDDGWDLDDGPAQLPSAEILNDGPGPRRLLSRVALAVLAVAFAVLAASWML